jgi:hypothetical protein
MGGAAYGGLPDERSLALAAAWVGGAPGEPFLREERCGSVAPGGAEGARQAPPPAALAHGLPRASSLPSQAVRGPYVSEPQASDCHFFLFFEN